MADEGLKRILVNISGRNFPVKVKPDDEATIRRLEKEVNEKINEFQISYQGKDFQDYMSLALLSYAFELHKQKNTEFGDVLYTKLDQIENLITESSL